MASGPQDHDSHSLASPSIFVPGPPQVPGTREPGEAIHVNRQGPGTRGPGDGAVEPAQHHINTNTYPTLHASIVNRPMALDLFCGTKSVSNRLTELGFQVVSVDNRPSTNPTFWVNILTWKYWEVFRPGDFEVIGASPPCTEYSRAKTIGTRDLEGADQLVKKPSRSFHF